MHIVTWIKDHRSYLRILLMGILSICAINGIYSLIANVSSLEIYHQHDSIDGVLCYVKDILDPYPKHYSECHNMTKIVANLTQNICQQYTDYSYRTLYDDFKQVRTPFIMLIIGSVVYGVFAIIHDWTLIYYRNSLFEVKFHPEDVAGVILFVLCPILYTICPCTDEQRKIHGICYVSASWTGIARCWLAIMAAWFAVVAGYLGLEQSITSLDPDVCACQCAYLLHQSDFWGLTSVTYIFVFLNVKFLRSWNYETIHLQHYLYLIQYSLPMAVANQINPSDTTGNMMTQRIQLNVQENAPLTINQYQSLNVKPQEKDDFEDRKNSETRSLSTPNVWRANFYCLSLLNAWLTIISFIVYVSDNPYHWNGNITISITVAASIVCVFYSILCLVEFMWSCKH